MLAENKQYFEIVLSRVRMFCNGHYTHYTLTDQVLKFRNNGLRDGTIPKYFPTDTLVRSHTV